MANRIGIRFDGFDNTAETIRVARLAEDAGASGIWMTQHLGYRDAFVSAMAFAMRTERARIVPAAVTPFIYHPTTTAMALATLAEAFPGRIAVSVAIGNLLDLKESGRAPADAVQAVEDYVADLRALASTQPAQGDREAYRLAGARMMFSPPAPPPVYITALGSEVAEKAGRIADGILLSAGFSAPFVAHCLKLFGDGARAAGRDAAAMPSAGFIHFSVSDDGRAAREDVRRKLAFLFRNRLMAENIAASGIPIDQDAIIDAVAARDLKKAAGLVPDEAIDAFGVAGTVAECRDALQAYLDTGLGEPVIQVAGDEHGKTLALRVIGEFTGG